MRLLLLAICIATAIGADAQSRSWRYYRNELSLGFGGTFFLGELGGNDGVGKSGIASVQDLEFALTRPVITAAYRYKLSNYFAIRTAFSYGRLEGDDQNTDEFFRNRRNLHFKSPVAELSATLEYYPFRERIGHMYRLSGVSGKKVKHLSPYLVAGAGGTYFNPKAQYMRSGNWIKLHDIQTEGVQYKRITAVVIYGLGLKYSLNNTWSIGLEISQRLAFTDYIDDVSNKYIDNSTFTDPVHAWLADPNTREPSNVRVPFSAGQQRGDNSDNDSYTFAIFSVHYRLLRGRLNLPKF